jgi:arginyl-tRNA synthetase
MDMKQKIRALIHKSLTTAHQEGRLPSSEFPEIQLEEPKVQTHGDLSSNIAMTMASIQKMPPRQIAEIIVAHLDDTAGRVAKTEIAGPGFINFFIHPTAWLPALEAVHAADTRYGACDIGKGRKVQVEFVSANPTGPLHVGHGRGAAVGDSVAAILRFCGFDVTKEYYINDSGRQINTLGRSTYLRYRELYGETVDFPEDCYQGDYIRDLAEKVREKKGEELLNETPEAAVAYCARLAASDILAGIRQDLKDFGVEFENWFSEQTLYDSGKVASVLEDFKRKNIIYEKDGAFWFKTSEWGDEKDRVVIRSNGQTTYFASDIAYHQDKFERGFERVIDVWGADHHGYIPRINASIAAAGRDRQCFDVILVQLVNLLRGGEPVAMSTRAGEFVTLEEVVNEVGRDAARFIFLTRHYESSLDFDLEVARKKSNDNPVYYVQYVHARIASILRKSDEAGRPLHENPDQETLARLQEAEEIELIKALARYPETVQAAAELMAPHRITYYLMNLASLFHSYYNRHKVLTDDERLTSGRLYLIRAIQIVIRNGLTLLGVSAPDQM